MTGRDRHNPSAQARQFLRMYFRQFTVALCLAPDCEGVAVRFYKGALLCRKHYLARLRQEGGEDRGEENEPPFSILT